MRTLEVGYDPDGCLYWRAWDGTLTSTWERTGEVSAEQARQIREKVARRHEATEYDALLAGGVDRDTARAMVWEAK